MRYRLGMLSGLVVLGVIGLGLLAGVFGSRAVEAARPSDYYSHTLKGAASCDLTTDFSWDSKAYAHKKGYVRLFLWGEDETGTGIRLAGYTNVTIDKGTASVWVHQDWGPQTSGEEYHARVVLYSSKGKGGAEFGSRLLLDDKFISCDTKSK